MTTETESRHLRLHVALWIVQVLLGLTFAGAAIWKLVTPITELAAQMPWMGQVSPAFLHMTAALDLLGGLGIVLPSLARVRPGVAVVAALGCAALMAGAIVFHLSRGEARDTPFNIIMMSLSLFVAWGRWRAAPIAAR